MKLIGILLCLTCCQVIQGCEKKREQVHVSHGTEKRIGTYDSRSVAIAFAGSEIFNKSLQDLMIRHKKAKAEGDSALIAALEAEGQEWQDQAHRQAFATAPVDNILVHYTTELQKISQQAGLDTILSKWNEEALAEYESAEQIDVTMDIVGVMKPNQRQLKFAKEVMKMPPRTVEELGQH